MKCNVMDHTWVTEDPRCDPLRYTSFMKCNVMDHTWVTEDGVLNEPPEPPLNQPLKAGRTYSLVANAEARIKS